MANPVSMTGEAPRSTQLTQSVGQRLTRARLRRSGLMLEVVMAEKRLTAEEAPTIGIPVNSLRRRDRRWRRL